MYSPKQRTFPKKNFLTADEHAGKEQQFHAGKAHARDLERVGVSPKKSTRCVYKPQFPLGSLSLAIQLSRLELGKEES